jgi:2-octaprenyl-6-methoxyphenol hydroxylase
MTQQTEILIAGAGAAGLTTGIALANAGFDVTIVGALDERRNARTVALFEASLRLYRALNLWDQLSAFATPLERIRLIDDTDSIFRPEPVLLRASEIGLDAFGANIENADLVAALAAAARETPGVHLIDDLLGDYILSSRNVSGRLRSGERIEASLLVGADGRKSSTRLAAGIATTEWSYPQTALTALLWHAKPHRQTSTEFHTRVGPCTLVPLGTTSAHPNRSSLVWLMSPEDAQRRMALGDAELAAEIRRQVHAIHGEMGLEGPRGAFPMSGMRCQRLTSTRVALVADAGHYFPPIGAQGLNLGLRDVAQLASSVTKHGRADAGAPKALADYEAARRLDVASRVAGVAMLNRSLLIHDPAADFVRAAGLRAMAGIGPLRRALMREGVAPAGRLPPLMQGPRDPGRARRGGLASTGA